MKICIDYRESNLIPIIKKLVSNTEDKFKISVVDENLDVGDIKIYDDGCQIQCKNQFHKIMQIKLDNNIVFQRITDQEYILLSALDYLNN